jgi:hypothetical protein
MPLLFFVSNLEEEESDVQSLDIHIGEKEPNFPEGTTVRMFRREENLKLFLMKSEWDRVTIYKSKECPQSVVDGLKDWLNLHMNLDTIDENIGEKSE